MCEAAAIRLRRRISPGDEATWLLDERSRPAGELVAPGLTRGELVRFHERPPTPRGWIFGPDVPVVQRGRSDVRLHIYRPERPVPRRPAVLLVHGGGWFDGHPFSQMRRACLLAARGFVTASLRYRRARWPAPLEDVRAGLRWLHGHAREIGADPERLALYGDSAGGHLAAMAALGPPAADTSPRVAAVVLQSPVTDLSACPTLEADVRRLLGRRWRTQQAAVSPVNHVRSGAPPFLTVTGADDAIVPLSSVEAFHRALDRERVANELHVVAGAGHAFDFHPDAWSALFEMTAGFLERWLGTPPPAPTAS